MQINKIRIERGDMTTYREDIQMDHKRLLWIVTCQQIGSPIRLRKTPRNM